MCRPRVDNAAASGWHLHQSLVGSATAPTCSCRPPGRRRPAVAGQWIAGLLAHARESCLLTTPTVNGYKRYQPFQLAPDRIAWGIDNRGAMIRALFGARRPRQPDREPRRRTRRQPLLRLRRSDRRRARRHRRRPGAAAADRDALCRRGRAPADRSGRGDRRLRRLGVCSAQAFGDDVVDYLVRLKRAEWERYLGALSEWEQAEYFGLY